MRGTELLIRPVGNGSGDLAQVTDFALRNPGVYDQEDYYAWQLGTNIPGIEGGERPAVGVWEEGDIGGLAVVKLLPDVPNAAELKYFRHKPPKEFYEGIGTARLLMNVTTKSVPGWLDERGLLTHDAQSVTVSLDTADPQAARFFERCGFSVVGRESLYNEDVLDFLMQRTVRI